MEFIELPNVAKPVKNLNKSLNKLKANSRTTKSKIRKETNDKDDEGYITEIKETDEHVDIGTNLLDSSIHEWDSSNRFQKFVTVPITLNGHTEKVSLRVEIKGIPHEIRRDVRVFASQCDYTVKNPNEQREKKLIHTTRVSNELNKKLYIRLKKTIENEDEVKAIHPDIVSVRFPTRVKKRWCWILFETEEKAKVAAEDLKKQKIIVKPATIAQLDKKPDHKKKVNLKKWL